MSQPSAPAPTPVARTSWLDRAVWVLLASFLLYKCVLPIPAGQLPAAIADVRVPTAGKPVLVVFDGSR